MNEFKNLLTYDQKEANVFVCGIPTDRNVILNRGSVNAPHTLRTLSYNLAPTDVGGTFLDKIKVYDCGDYAAEDFNKLTTELQFNFLSKDGFHVIFGGDHSTTIAAERAFYCKCLKMNREPVIIHLNSHLNFFEVYKDNVFSSACNVYRANEYGYDDHNIALIGVRSFEKDEIELLKKHKSIDVFKAVDVKKLGVEDLLKYLINKYSSDNNLVYLSLDMDVVDPSFAPGVENPVPFGLTNYEVAALLSGLTSGLNVDVLDLVEVAPNYDINNITSLLALKLLYEVFSSINKK